MRSSYTNMQWWRTCIWFTGQSSSRMKRLHCQWWMKTTFWILWSKLNSNTLKLGKPCERPSLLSAHFYLVTLCSSTLFVVLSREGLLKEGLVKAIGVSNFTVEQLEELSRHSEIVPAANQVEFHPYLNQRELLEYCKSKGMKQSFCSALLSRSPLCSCSLGGCQPLRYCGDGLLIARRAASKLTFTAQRWSDRLCGQPNSQVSCSSTFFIFHHITHLHTYLTGLMLFLCRCCFDGHCRQASTWSPRVSAQSGCVRIWMCLTSNWMLTRWRPSMHFTTTIGSTLAGCQATTCPAHDLDPTVNFSEFNLYPYTHK